MCTTRLEKSTSPTPFLAPSSAGAIPAWSDVAAPLITSKTLTMLFSSASASEVAGKAAARRGPGARATIARSVGALGKIRAPLRYEEKSKWFMVLYDDGDKEEMTLAELNKHLLPEHTTLRARYDEDQAPPPGSPFSDRTMTDAEALMQLRDTVPEPRSARADPPPRASLWFVQTIRSTTAPVLHAPRDRSAKSFNGTEWCGVRRRDSPLSRANDDVLPNLA